MSWAAYLRNQYAWLVQDRYIILTFLAARALHASLVEEYVKIGCLQCKACYDRLWFNSKPEKVAVIAVANKLIRQAFAVVTQEKPYVDGYISSKK